MVAAQPLSDWIQSASGLEIHTWSHFLSENRQPLFRKMLKTRPPKGTKMSIEQWIDNEVKGNDVVLFMKGTPQFPQCGFSGQVVQILDYLGVPYKGINVLESDDLRQGIKSYAQW